MRNDFNRFAEYSEIKEEILKSVEIFNQKNLSEHFKEDEVRVEKFSIIFSNGKGENNINFYYDYSKNYVSDSILKGLRRLLFASNFYQETQSLLKGDLFNFTEKRQVLHYALRYNFADKNRYTFPFLQENSGVVKEIAEIKEKMKVFTNKVRYGDWLGFSGKTIKYIVNIGIGGSDLGPKFVVDALKEQDNSGINTYFVSNVDPTDLLNTLKHVELERTLFVIASKTFTTQETIQNAKLAKSLFLDKTSCSPQQIEKHFIALSTNIRQCEEFGIAKENVFEFWDWVGGRFSLWSAIGLSISLSIGWDNFEQLLEGAYLADKHFFTIETEKNIPVTMALLGVLYRNYYNCSSYGIIPYSQNLKLMTEYLQQLEMESNGKYVNKYSEKVAEKTAPVIWGSAGTNAQHSYFQMLHQGTDVIPLDFITFKRKKIVEEDQAVRDIVESNYKILLSNFIAQTEALMLGKNKEMVEKELRENNLSIDEQEIEKLIPHKVFEGNKPTTSILINELTPRTLGFLIATYENKVLTQGIIWEINSYDQWGVELGKQLAKEVLKDLGVSKESRKNLMKANQGVKHDGSTEKLIELISSLESDFED